MKLPIPSYVHGASSMKLLGETIGERLRKTVERFGDREALVVRDQGRRATYRELWEETSKAARGLLARGVKKGDRLGLWTVEGLSPRARALPGVSGARSGGRCATRSLPDGRGGSRRAAPRSCR